MLVGDLEWREGCLVGEEGVGEGEDCCQATEP